MKDLTAVLIMVLVFAGSTMAASGPDFTITIELPKQGVVKTKGREFREVGTREIISPRDIATGQASGKRQHKPIVIVKEVDKSSPLLLKAYSGREVLKSVLLEFRRRNPEGQEEVYYTVKLTNALISSIKSGPQADTATEEITLDFQKIEYHYSGEQPRKRYGP